MIYLEVHLTHSEQKLHDFVRKFNHDLKVEDMKNCLNPDYISRYRADSLKSCHTNTMIKILHMFYKHLDNFSKVQLTNPEDTTFVINNVAIATKMGYSISINKKTKARYSSTAWRHISKLIAVGLLHDKVFHGSNSGYEIQINPEILVATPNYDFTQELLTHAEKLSGLQILPHELTKKLSSLIPSFSEFPSGKIASCNHIAERTLKELNINIECVFDDFLNNEISSLNSIKKEPEKEQESITLNCQMRTESKSAAVTNQNTQMEESSAARAKKSNQSDVMASMIMFVNAAWEYARICFDIDGSWKNKAFSIGTIEMTKKLIAEFFKNELQKENPQFQKLFISFTNRIQSARDFVLRLPHRFIPPPTKYFDPFFKDGFVGTREWKRNSKKKKEENKDRFTKMELVSILYITYLKTPDVRTLKQCTQRLGKFSDEQYLELFLKLVDKEKSFTHQTYQEYAA